MVCRLDYFRHFERPIEEKSQWNRLLISPLIYKSLLIGFERNVPIYEFTWYRVKSKKEFDFWRLFIDLLSVKLVYRNPATTEAVHLSNVYVWVQFVLFFAIILALTQFENTIMHGNQKPKPSITTPRKILTFSSKWSQSIFHSNFFF